MNYKPRIFLSYARPDQHAVERWYDTLSRAGFDPWMDTRDLHPGQDWREALMAEIQRASTFLVFLSHNSVDREGFIQEEIREALDILDQRKDEDVYFLPVRLEPCEMPARMDKFQWIDLFEPNGVERLARALSVGLVQAQLREAPEVAPETPDLLKDLVAMAHEREWLDGPYGPKSEPLLDPEEREHIHKFAHLTCGTHPEILARLDAEVPPGSHKLFLLKAPEGGEEELAEVYRTIVMRTEIDNAAFREISAAVHAFIEAMYMKQVQVNVFGCVFVLLKFAMSKVRHWDPQLKQSVIDLIHYVAENSSARVRNTGGTLSVSWEGDLGAIKFVFPDSSPW